MGQLHTLKQRLSKAGYTLKRDKNCMLVQSKNPKSKEAAYKAHNVSELYVITQYITRH